MILAWQPRGRKARFASLENHEYLVELADGQAQATIRHAGTIVASKTGPSGLKLKTWCEQHAMRTYPPTEIDPWVEVPGAARRTFEHAQDTDWQLRCLSGEWVLRRLMLDGHWHQAGELGRSEKAAKRKATGIVVTLDDRARDET